MDAQRMIETLTAQLSSQKSNHVGQTMPDDRSGGSQPLPSSGRRSPDPDQPTPPVAPPAGAEEREQLTHPAGAPKTDKAGVKGVWGRHRKTENFMSFSCQN